MCDDRIDVVYFYPDGTLGRTAVARGHDFFLTGWSLEPDPCLGLSGEEYRLWATYVDYHNGYFDSGPDLTSRTDRPLRGLLGLVVLMTRRRGRSPHHTSPLQRKDLAMRTLVLAAITAAIVQPVAPRLSQRGWSSTTTARSVPTLTSPEVKSRQTRSKLRSMPHDQAIGSRSARAATPRASRSTSR